MESLKILFFLENQYLQTGIETVLDKTRNGFISRELLNMRRELKFPVYEQNGTYYLQKTEEIIGPGEAELRKLQDGDFFYVKDTECPYQFLVLAERYLSAEMKKYHLPLEAELQIGRADDANIILDINENISRKHAVLRMKAGEGYIQDISEKAGVYLNGKKITASRLQCGDQIMIMGYTIVYLKEYMMVPKQISVQGIEPCKKTQNMAPRKNRAEVVFERNPRIYKSLITDEIRIDAPPACQTRKQQPFILAAGPTLTMSLAMMAQLGLALARLEETGNFSSIISNGTMTVSLLAGAVLWPFLSRKYYKKQEKKEETYRKEKYTAYLEEKRKEIEGCREYNRRIWNVDYYPGIEEMLGYVERKNRRIWEKSPADQDFLSVRLGIGERSSELLVKVPEDHFCLEDDALLEQAIQLGKENQRLSEVPIALSLRDRKMVGIVGDKEKINKLIWCMITGIVVMHAPDEVKIGIVADKNQALDFEWVLNLPHIWNEIGEQRFFASDPEEVKEFLLYLEETAKEKSEINIPHYVVFVLNEKLLESISLGKSSYIAENFKGVTIVYAAEFFSRIPREAEAIILNDAEQSGIYRKNEDDNQLIPFVPDELNYLQIQKMMQLFEKIENRHWNHKVGIPERISFLSMYQAGNVHMLEIERRWRESKISRSMAAPIGMKRDGELFYLDIHEKYHGCHGLVAGMTGSGKSEFLQEYILSLMLNYSPDDIAFILIDFKGGDMARPFLKAPHVSATISNLSGNMLHRAKVSLEAEIQNRQKLFNATAQELGIDKLDINSWHKYMEEGKIKKKLPHLIIIIDEFAQLRTQQPDFLEYLVNVAQVGRSLGIHLILATQKPSGVVSPQIWSNSRFRVCLKVLDQEDSKEMIRRKDAAAIRQPGRAYVQVGYDEIFEEVQTGFSGADYIAYDRYMEDGENSIEMTGYTAGVRRTAKKRADGKKSGRTQLEESVKEVILTAKAMHLCVKPLWKPVLPKKIFLSQCVAHSENFLPEQWDKDNDAATACGMCDIPELQEQKPFELCFQENGHVAVYGASGSGKTTFLQTMAFSMAQKYSPDLLQFYVLDFGGRMLGNLREAPHCVAMAFEDEKQKSEHMIQQIRNQMELRKKVFAEKECNTYSSYLETTGQKLPMLLVIIDNYTVIHEQMPRLEEGIIQIAANGKTYGIYLVVTGNSRNAIYYKTAEHIKTRIVFQMNELQNYRDLLNIRTAIEPEDVKGRAVISYGEFAVEMQTALPFDAVNESQMYSKLKQTYRKMRFYYGENQKESTVREDRKNILIEKKTEKESGRLPERIPVFEGARDRKEWLSLGTSLYDERKQGFLLKETKRIFIGSETKTSLESVIENGIIMENWELYRFSLEPESKKFWHEIRTEEEIGRFLQRCLEQKKQKRILLYIDDFSDFYDTISDEDLVVFGKYLKTQKQEQLLIITQGIFKKLSEYKDTGLYVYLVRCEDGMIMDGGIDNSKIMFLNNTVSRSDPEVRKKQLERNQAILYHGDTLAYIKVR